MLSTYAQRKIKNLYAAFVLLLVSSSFDAIASEVWQYNLSTNEKVSVVALEKGKFVSYFLSVGTMPKLLLTKIYKTQKIDKKKIKGFIQIEDLNTERQRVLFRLAINSSASGTGRGECGAGIEEYLFIVGINESVNFLSTLHRLTLESCLSNFVLDDGADSVQLVYNKEKTETLLRIKYGIYPGWKLPVTAIYSLDDGSFNLEGRPMSLKDKKN